MSKSSHIPAGFCPRCDYAMDAGRCPECGRDVPPGKLATSARRQRFRRVVVRSVKSIVLLALIGGAGYGIYHETRPDRWVRYCTTNYLFSSRWISQPHIHQEITRRFYDKRLTAEQTTRYLTEWWDMRTIATPIRSPRPVGRTTGVGFRPHNPDCLSSFFSGCGGDFDPFEKTPLGEEIWIDGRVAMVKAPFVDSRTELGELIARLPAGEHLIESRRDTRFNIDKAFLTPQCGSKYRLPHLPCTISTSKKMTIEVVEAGIGDFVTAEYDDAIVYQLKNENWFSGFGLFTGRTRTANNRYLGLVGTLDVLHADPETMSDATVSTFRIPEESCRFHATLREFGDQLCNTEVYFTPDAELAFDAGCTNYFNGIVEWHSLVLKNGIPQLGVPDVVRPFERTAPTPRIASAKE